MLSNSEPFFKTLLISKGIVVISSTLGFILAILPNLSNVSHFYEFITGLLTHTNSYLIDSPQMPTALRMIVNFTRAYRDLPTLFIYTAVCIILTIIAFFLWHKQPSKKPGPWGITIGLILQAILLTGFFAGSLQRGIFFIYSRHYPSTDDGGIKTYKHTPVISQIINIFVIIAVAIEFVSSFHAQILYHNANVNSIASTEKQEKQIISDYAKSVNEKENAVKVIWRYGTYSPCYSLQFGNEYTGSAFNEEISLICHGQSDVAML